MTRVLIFFFRIALLPLRWRFELRLSKPWRSQKRVLKRIVRAASQTEFGRSRGLTARDRLEEFSFKVPVAGYDAFEPWIQKQMCVEGKVLTAEAVRLYEPTSGSSGKIKVIPYTRSLKRAFNMMFLLWMHDLLSFGPRLRTGRFYFSLSPRMGSQDRTVRGKPIGLADDSEYLIAPLRKLLARYFVKSPPTDGSEPFQKRLAARLAAQTDLEVISVWSPSFLQSLLECILENGYHHGLSWKQLWPNLKIISCWGSASATMGALELRKQFPHVFVQFKGLVATEAPMTLPLLRANGFVPLVDEIFYEFIDADGQTRLLHELKAGQEYAIVISHPAGLYRYRIGDRVRVTHFYRATPCLEFIGREGGVSDLVGEKLGEEFVRNVARELGLASGFVTLIPRRGEAASHYVALLKPEALNDWPEIEDLARRLDEALCQAYHYRYARFTGQLAACRVVVTSKAASLYDQCFLQRGMKWGDIKPRALITNIDDADALQALISKELSPTSFVGLARSQAIAWLT
ncbi:MAG TPA: GH3 auxin-responsive promoter family protein [Bdellovibrionales bacterium]|nr:GH3 auxin-responsive promoter family protein [Bdellovibrionales bacterium]